MAKKIDFMSPKTGRMLKEDDSVVNILDAGQPINTASIVKTATIASGASQSGEIDCRGYRLARITMPSAWTTAALTFLTAAASGGTFVPVYDDSGMECSIASPAVSVSYGITTLALPLSGIQFLKLRSGVAATPVNQAAERVITVVLAG